MTNSVRREKLLECGIGPIPDEEERPIPGVYFLQSESNGKAIKIGYSLNVRERVRSLGVGFPDELHHLATIVGVRAEYERRLHKVFAQYRRRYEWFHPVKELLAYIRDVKQGKEGPPEHYVKGAGLSVEEEEQLRYALLKEESESRNAINVRYRNRGKRRLERRKRISRLKNGYFLSENDA